jgi:hypothetical protein
MKLPIHLIGLFVAVLLVSDPAASVQAGTTKPNPSVPVIPVVPEIQLPQSVFAIPSQPSEGRNPFFPQSTFGFQAPTVAVKPISPGEVDTSAFILNGITSPPKRTAMINGRTFEAGESGEVRLPNGARALIKCEEIRSESAVILVNGARREVKFRTGL